MGGLANIFVEPPDDVGAFWGRPWGQEAPESPPDPPKPPPGRHFGTYFDDLGMCVSVARGFVFFRDDVCLIFVAAFLFLKRRAKGAHSDFPTKTNGF